MKASLAALAGVALPAAALIVFMGGAALAQSARIALAPVATDAPGAGQAALQTPAPQDPAHAKPAVLLLRGLDKITGRATDIVAPIGTPVHFATLTIVARYCYSTPPSETPETTAFLQIEDHRPDQPARRVFSGWMYASSPGLNGLEHPLYDVWVIKCTGSSVPQAVAQSKEDNAPAPVKSPDASDADDEVGNLPADAGR